MYYWICIRTDGSMGLFETGPNRTVSYPDFQYLKSECGMEWAETVTIEYRGNRYMLLVDEEGKLTGKDINPVASMLYNSPFDLIMGDVAVLACPSGEDMLYLAEAEGKSLFEQLKAVNL